MRFKVGQQVIFSPGNKKVTIVGLKAAPFGTFYVVEFEDGSQALAGWNNLREAE